MNLKRTAVIGTILACTSLIWGCGNGNNNTNHSAVSESRQTEQAQSWGDPKRLEASHLEALERMEKDHIHRMVSLSASTDGDQVMTTLERSSQKLEEMRPLAEMLQYEGHPTLLQRIQDMSGDIEGSKNALTQMKSTMKTGKIKIQSAKTDALQHINSFRDYHEYVEGQAVKIMSQDQ
jgi:D-arabinose 1-dehydrogenase-like Zn-dependent alcohol dehydrogenase